MNLLIINADDFGLTEGVTQAIVDCHEAGSVTSTTMMVCMPGTEFAARKAREHPELGIGLHFTLTLGPPAAPPSEVASLVDESGNFPLRAQQERRVLRRRTRPEEIEIELRAQLARLGELGVTPTHIDSHQHIHVLPRVFDVVARVADELDLPVRMPWRWHGPTRQRPLKRLKGQALRWMVARNARKWRGRIPMNSGHCSVFDVVTRAGDISADTYDHLLSQPTEALELMVHPGTSDAETASLVRIGEIGTREYELLRSLSLSELGAHRGFRAGHFGALARPRG